MRATVRQSWVASRALAAGPTTSASWAGGRDEQRRAWLQRGIVPLDYPEPVAADWPELLGIVRGDEPSRREMFRTARRSASDGGSTRKEAPRSLFHYRSAWNGCLAIIPADISNLDSSLLAFSPSKMVFGHTLIVVFAMDDIRLVSQCSSHASIRRLGQRFLGPIDERSTSATLPPTVSRPSRSPRGRDAAASTGSRRQGVLRLPRLRSWSATATGLTKTYNRFHDRVRSTTPRSSSLRGLHAAMDRAVLNAYGWTDILTDCEFLLDYEIDEATWGNRKKPYRHRWPDAVRDEVLARLLELNAERVAAEARVGSAGRVARR